MTVADTDSLLNTPPHDVGKLQQALRIRALSPGWRRPLRDMTETAGDSPRKLRRLCGLRGRLDRLPADACCADA
ncbi:3-alpha domain-containing protein, partial [Streptomyces sulfonofaciens]|uniref:3-alpha domain-containing protein n=1 Tax=Streptomyces sulfonofaciens TaxID=68272 RepID=UPI003571235F